MELKPLVPQDEGKDGGDSEEVSSDEDDNELDEAQRELRRNKNKLPDGLQEFLELDKLGSDPETLLAELERSQKLVAEQFAARVDWGATATVRKRKGKGTTEKVQAGTGSRPMVIKLGMCVSTVI